MTLQTLTYQAGERTVSFKMDLDPTFPADRWIINADMNHVPYEPDVTAVMFRTIKEGDTVVDVGANVGYFTCMMAALVGPTGKVYSFEPASENLDRLYRNLGVNEFGQVKVVPCAVDAAPRRVELYLSADDSGGNALWDPGMWWENTKSKLVASHVTVEAVTLGMQVEERVSLIKIDTEGAEERVLKGAWAILRGEKPTVIAELSHFALAQLGSSEQSLRALMAAHGYSTFLPYYTGDLPKLVPPNTRIAFPHNVNIFFTSRRS